MESPGVGRGLVSASQACDQSDRRVLLPETAPRNVPGVTRALLKGMPVNARQRDRRAPGPSRTVVIPGRPNPLPIGVHASKSLLKNQNSFLTVL
ncbi:MAG: hypothetical protein R6W69_10665 [Anaerolineales bacterium]